MRVYVVNNGHVYSAILLFINELRKTPSSLCRGKRKLPGAVMGMGWRENGKRLPGVPGGLFDGIAACAWI